jgi:hypothetical protein
MRLVTLSMLTGLLTACATPQTAPAVAVPQDRMLNATPLSSCVVLCITTIQQANTEGSTVSGAAGDVALDKSKAQESAKDVARVPK